MNKEQLITKALALLARRDHSVYELRMKLIQRGGEQALVDLVLKQLGQERLLDEQRFAESYARMRVNRGFGLNRIRVELQERRVNNEIILEALKPYESAWEQRIQESYKKRFGAQPWPSDITEQAKCHRFLSYRGFTEEQIARFRNLSHRLKTI